MWNLRNDGNQRLSSTVLVVDNGLRTRIEYQYC